MGDTLIGCWIGTWSPGGAVLTTSQAPPCGLHVIPYPAILDVPRELVEYVPRSPAAQRRARGTHCGSRALTCWKRYSCWRVSANRTTSRYSGQASASAAPPPTGETRHDTLRLHPVLHAELDSTEFTVSCRGQPITITVTHSRVTLRLHPSAASPIRLCVEEVERTQGPGRSGTYHCPATPRFSPTVDDRARCRRQAGVVARCSTHAL